MGTWGTALFANDLASDIRDLYQACLGCQYSDEKAEEYILSSFEPEDDDDDCSVFWMALAAVEWKKGRLSNLVKEKALACIEKGADLSLWEEYPSEHKKRVKVIEELKSQLLSPMPPRKKVRKPTVTHCPWKPGDLLLYKLNTIEDRYPQYQNKYVLIRIAALMKLPLFDIERDTLFDLVPVCAVYDWMSDNACVPDHYEDLTYLPIYAKTYNCKSVSFLMSELKKKEIQIVGHEADFESKTQGILDVKRGKAVLGTFDSLEISIAYNYERIHG